MTTTPYVFTKHEYEYRTTTSAYPPDLPSSGIQRTAWRLAYVVLDHTEPMIARNDSYQYTRKDATQYAYHYVWERVFQIEKEYR